MTRAAQGGGPPAALLQVSQNKYLALGRGDHPGREMQAIVEIETRGLGRAAGGTGPRTEAAEVIVIDCSGSMSTPGSKIAAARRAAAAAVDALRDGTHFAVVAGNESARVVYPYGGRPAAPRLAVATPESRLAATRAVAQLDAHGGTAFSAWLALARELLTQRGTAIRHVLMLTDGENDLDPPGRLDRELDACAEVLSCDARGIGTGWSAEELKQITSRLHGEADGVLDDSLLAAEFRALTEASMARSLAGLRIRVTHREGSGLRVLRQRYPLTRDLIPLGVRIGERTWEFATRAWGDETREYEMSITADPRGDQPGEDVQLGYVELVAPDAPDTLLLPDPVPILAQWTNDPARFTSIDPAVRHYDQHSELDRAVGSGCAAYDGGDRVLAGAEWGRAVRLAYQLEDWRMLARLKAVVEIADPAAGAVRLRDSLQPLDLNAVLVASEHTTPLRRGAAGPGLPASTAGGPHRCADCGRLSPRSAVYCEKCGKRLHPGAEGG